MALNGPIAVFDSGLGGLTVLRELRAVLPQHSYVYVGDTARLPYGTKSAETVIKYAQNLTTFLLGFQPAAVVIACNTASAVATPAVKALCGEAPVVTMIDPAAAKAAALTRNGRIAVMATQGTCRSGVYRKALSAINPGLMVQEIPCQLLVALAEEGWHDTVIAESAIRAYLDPVFADAYAPDTLIMGCTHFPLFAPLLAKLYGERVQLVNTGMEAAKLLAQTLPVTLAGQMPQTQFFATDAPSRFAQAAAPFYGAAIAADAVGLVDLMTLDIARDEKLSQFA